MHGKIAFITDGAHVPISIIFRMLAARTILGKKKNFIFYEKKTTITTTKKKTLFRRKCARERFFELIASANICGQVYTFFFCFLFGAHQKLSRNIIFGI